MTRRRSYPTLVVAIGLGTLSASCVSLAHAWGPGSDAAVIGGPLKVDGPLEVQGPLVVGGPCTVHGPVRAAALKVGGPVYTTLPRGETPGSAGQAFATPLTVGGPLEVDGPLTVAGELTVGGPLTSEPPPDQERVSQFVRPPKTEPDDSSEPQDSQVLTLPSNGGVQSHTTPLHDEVSE